MVEQVEVFDSEIQLYPFSETKATSDRNVGLRGAEIPIRISHFVAGQVVGGSCKGRGIQHSATGRGWSVEPNGLTVNDIRPRLL